MSNTKGLRAFHNARLKKQQRKAYDLAEARNRALSLHQAGRIPEAQAVCREILEHAPRHFDALHLLGVTHYQSGRHEEAARLLHQALLVEPRAWAACSNHGIVLHELKRYDAALARF